jgi:hypothetical protein
MRHPGRIGARGRCVSRSLRSRHAPLLIDCCCHVACRAFARGSLTPDADRFSAGLIPTADDIEGYRHDQSSGLAASANFIRCDMNVAASTISHSIGGILPSDVARIEQRLVAAHGRRSGSK